MRRLRAVFRFRASDEPEQVKGPLAILIHALRLLRLHDPDAELTVTPDHEPPTAYDADGD